MKPNYKKMNKKIIRLSSMLLMLNIFLILNSCSNTANEADKTATQKTVYASDAIPFFKHFKLILGDGSNVGHPIDFEHKQYSL